MARFLLRSAGGAIATLLAISLVSFLLVALLPGDLALVLLGESATPERIAEMRELLGLNKPLAERYLLWLGRALTGDLGISVGSGEPVLHAIMERVPVTAELMLLTQVLALALSIPLGVWSAYRRGGVADIAGLTGSLMLLSTPSFLLGVVLIYVFSLHLQWLPATGYVPMSEGLVNNLVSMTLPVLTLALVEVPIYLRLLRAEMIVTLQQSFITLARAMGLPQRRILLENALRPSSLNLITAIGINMGRLMGGAIIIEVLFGLPGVGQLLVESIYQREFLVMQGIVLFVAIIFIAINLVIDLVYGLVDPRVRAEQAS